MIKTLKRITLTKSGFTLVELLITIVVLMVVGSIMSAIIISSLRGAQRVTSVNVVRQNGNYALTQMSKMIRSAQRFEGVSVTQNGPYTCDILPGATTPTPVPQAYKFLKMTAFDGGETIFMCDDSGNTIASLSAERSISLLNNTDVIFASYGACSFTCIKTSQASAPSIGIQFILKNRQRGAFEFFENQASIPFETSIIPRNLY